MTADWSAMMMLQVVQTTSRKRATLAKTISLRGPWVVLLSTMAVANP